MFFRRRRELVAPRELCPGGYKLVLAEERVVFQVFGIRLYYWLFGRCGVCGRLVRLDDLLDRGPDRGYLLEHPVPASIKAE